MNAERGHRLYDDLAGWWPLLSPPDDYGEEAEALLDYLERCGAPRSGSLLELGAGGGSLASHLKSHYRLTLTDRSPAMLAVSRAVNPECEHLAGDMRALRLDRVFDLVLIHDAIMYATDPAAVAATLRTAAVHCRAGGAVVILPDHVRETFQPETDHGGHDAPDGRGLRYLEWSWDPDPSDDTYLVEYAFLLRAADGTVAMDYDRHIEGLFGRTQWLHWLAEAGLPATAEIDRWGRDVFVGIRTGFGVQLPASGSSPAT
jgi:SAM-dependent methyltransferase